VFHFVDRLVVLVLCELSETPILVHLRVQEVLVDRYKLVVEDFVEVANNVGVAFHVSISFLR